MSPAKPRANVRLLFDENLPWGVEGAPGAEPSCLLCGGQQGKPLSSPDRGSLDENVLKHAADANQVVVTNNLDMNTTAGTILLSQTHAFLAYSHYSQSCSRRSQQAEDQATGRSKHAPQMQGDEYPRCRLWQENSSETAAGPATGPRGLGSRSSTWWRRTPRPQTP